MTEEIGSVLRSRRQQMGLSLEQVAEQTKIRKMHLHALEEELFDDLPGKVYVIGFLQNYARVLEIPAEPLLNALEERGYGKTKKEKLSQSSELMTATRTPSRKSPLRFLVWLILLLLIVAAAWFYYFSPYLNENKEQKETLTPGSPLSDTSRVQEGAEQPAAEPAAGQAEADLMPGVPATDGELAEQTGASSIIPEEGAKLKLLVEGEGNFSVSIDGEETREYKANPGLSLSWFAKDKADLVMDIDGPATLWIGQQELTLSGQQSLKLVSAKNQEGGQ